MKQQHQGSWRKSSRSYAAPNCVELWTTRRGVAVRDSKSVTESLSFTAPRFSVFLRAIKGGELERRGHALSAMP